MTPSRWLFITAVSACTGITLATPVTSLTAKFLVCAACIAVLVAWRAGWRGCAITGFVVVTFWIREQGAVPVMLPQPVWLVHSRQVFVERLAQVLPDQEAQLGAGMLIGTTDGIDRQTITDFRATGLSHILAVSGSNLSIILAGLTTLGVALSRRQYAAFTLSFAPLFTLFTGGEPSILRAAVMAGLTVCVKLMGRRVAGMNVLAAACLVMLVVDPTLLWGSIGFQLSVAATFGLIAWSGPLAHGFARVHLPGGMLLAATLGATFGTLPITLLTFQQLSLIGPFANLLVVPLVPLVMALVAVTGGVALVFPAAATFLSVGAWFVLRLVEQLVQYAAHVPWAAVTLDPLLAAGIAAGLAAVLAFGFARNVSPLFQ